jgi:hypothetical protein
MPEPLSKDRFRAIVANAVAAVFGRNISPQGPQGPQGPVGGNGNNGTAGNGTNGWRIEDLGYFNPGLSDPGDAAVKSLQNHTYYRDVYVFVERLNDLQAIKGEDLVLNNIHASLRGSALDWYTVELTDFERRSLRQLPLVDGWYVMLINRFKLRPSEALGKLTTPLDLRKYSKVARLEHLHKLFSGIPKLLTSHLNTTRSPRLGPSYTQTSGVMSQNPQKKQ